MLILFLFEGRNQGLTATRNKNKLCRFDKSAAIVINYSLPRRVNYIKPEALSSGKGL